MQLLDRTLRSRVLLFTGVVACTMLVANGANLLSTRSLSRTSGNALEGTLPAQRALGTVSSGLASVDGVGAKLLNSRLSDLPVRKEMFARADEQLKALDQASASFDSLPKTPELASAWKEFVPLRDAWREQVDKLMGFQRAVQQAREAGRDPDDPRLLSAEGRSLEAFAAMAEAYRKCDVVLARAEAANGQQTAALRAGAASAASRSTWISLACLVLGLAAVAFIGLWLHRSISQTSAALVAETERLVEAVDAGRLDERAAVGTVAGEFAAVVEGLNRVLDALVRPLRVTAANLDRVSRGDIPAPITDPYRGEFEAMKQSLNQSIAAVNGLLADARMLTVAAVEGRLSVRADASRHRGEYRNIVEGVNAMFAAMVAPAEEASRVLDALSHRDLRARTIGDFHGDHARLRDALNGTAEALHASMAQVAEVTQQVSSASMQIASSSQAVASGASEQAASIQETMASLERISGATRASAEGAQAADRLARQARGSADQGTQAMEQMGLAMTRIRASAEGTAQIIKDINEITFQTNLLALNAAVEAARAGEAGRGFAVVAEEVRSLALRSKEAAQKTEALIRDSVRQAESGEATSRAVSQKLAEIAGAVGQVSDQVGEIAAAAREQAAGFEQVTRAVAEMDKVTQQNAASAEESSSAAGELSSQSEELASMVGSFQLEGAAAPQAPRRLIRTDPDLPPGVGPGRSFAPPVELTNPR
jgi:methyl-accepting chemotaxis protein